jgi:glycosyltransferase involved in cell wall biosynthesis
LNRAEKPFTNWKRWLQKIADRCVTAYLFASNEFASDWKKNISTEKIHEIVQASSVFTITDKKTARTNLNLPQKDMIFLWVGALIPRKDPLTIVKGFTAFCRSNQNAKLYMIYQSDELLSEAKSIIHRENAADRIQLVGKIEHADLSDWYNSADFFVLGSHFEGNGVAAIEGMSCGCVPLLSDITSFRRMTGPGKCGFLFEPGNADDLVKQLQKATASNYDEERSKTIGQFNTELTFDAIAKKINCITGYKDQCQPQSSNHGSAS